MYTHTSTGRARPAATLTYVAQRLCHAFTNRRLPLAVSHAIRAMMIPHRTISKSTAPAKTSDTSPLCPAASLREGELVATRRNRFTMPNIAPRERECGQRCPAEETTNRIGGTIDSPSTGHGRQHFEKIVIFAAIVLAWRSAGARQHMYEQRSSTSPRWRWRSPMRTSL